MSCVIVNDACCLIDLQKGQLLHVLVKLPFRLVVPYPIRKSELLTFTDQEWRLLDDGGMETYDLLPDEMQKVPNFLSRYPISANDAFCLATTQCYEESILLTGDKNLRKAAAAESVPFHGVLWVIDQLKAAGVCKDDLLVSALEIWRDDRAVRLPLDEIERRLRRLR